MFSKIFFLGGALYLGIWNSVEVADIFVSDVIANFGGVLYAEDWNSIKLTKCVA